VGGTVSNVEPNDLEESGGGIDLEEGGADEGLSTGTVDSVYSAAGDNGDEGTSKDMNAVVFGTEEGSGAAAATNVCKDDPNFLYKDKPGVTCNYIGTVKPEKCLKLHNGVEIGISSCPESCDMVDKCMAASASPAAMAGVTMGGVGAAAGVTTEGIGSAAAGATTEGLGAAVGVTTEGVEKVAGGVGLGYTGTETGSAGTIDAGSLPDEEKTQEYTNDDAGYLQGPQEDLTSYVGTKSMAAEIENMDNSNIGGASFGRFDDTDDANDDEVGDMNSYGDDDQDGSGDFGDGNAGSYQNGNRDYDNDDEVGTYQKPSGSYDNVNNWNGVDDDSPREDDQANAARDDDLGINEGQEESSLGKNEWGDWNGGIAAEENNEENEWGNNEENKWGNDEENEWGNNSWNGQTSEVGLGGNPTWDEETNAGNLGTGGGYYQGENTYSNNAASSPTANAYPDNSWYEDDDDGFPTGLFIALLAIFLFFVYRKRSQSFQEDTRNCARGGYQPVRAGDHNKRW